MTDLTPKALPRVDVHCHLVPGIDDGSRSLEESLEMARALVDMGYGRIAVTPHIRPGVFNNTPEIIWARVAELQEHLAAAHIPLSIEGGAEHFFDPELPARLAPPYGWGKKRSTFLVELPHNQPPPRAVPDVFFRFRVKGMKIILAHPERYKNPEAWLGALREQGTLSQVSLSSLGGKFGNTSKNAARSLVERDLVDLLATDAHSVRDVLLSKEGLTWLEKARGPKEALRLTSDVPRALLE